MFKINKDIILEYKQIFNNVLKNKNKDLAGFILPDNNIHGFEYDIIPDIEYNINETHNEDFFKELSIITCNVKDNDKYTFSFIKKI